MKKILRKNKKKEEIKESLVLSQLSMGNNEINPTLNLMSAPEFNGLNGLSLPTLSLTLPNIKGTNEIYNVEGTTLHSNTNLQEMSSISFREQEFHPNNNMNQTKM